jgi:hypothetical protein
MLTLSGLRLVSVANRREHWAARHRRGKREAEALGMAWAAAGFAPWRCPWPVRVTWTRIGGKPLDTDNLTMAFKALRDALAERLGVDDGDTTRIRWRYRQRPGPFAVRLCCQPWVRRSASTK